MKTKLELIQEAYGSQYEELKPFINENGWLKWNDECPINPVISDYDYHKKDSSHRPKSLQGIEDNNGWIKIESEEDLPKDSSIEYHFYDFKAHERMQALQVSIKAVSFVIINNLYSKGLCTHYQPIDKPKPPLF